MMVDYPSEYACTYDPHLVNMYTCTIQVLTTAVIGMDAPNMVGSVLPKSPLEMTENKTDNYIPWEGNSVRQKSQSICACT